MWWPNQQGGAAPGSVPPLTGGAVNGGLPPPFTAGDGFNQSPAYNYHPRFNPFQFLSSLYPHLQQNPNLQFQNPNLQFHNPNLQFQNPNTVSSQSVVDRVGATALRPHTEQKHQNPDLQNRNLSRANAPVAQTFKEQNTKKRNLQSHNANGAMPQPIKDKANIQMQKQNFNKVSLQPVIDRADTAVKQVHKELVDAGAAVTSWKVAEKALMYLKATSWASLGLQMHDVPLLHKLFLMEGKVNAFIHCYVAAHRITSLYDMSLAICKNEGVQRFEDLGLGPLPRHELVGHYFSVPPDLLKLVKITTEEVIGFLYVYLDKRKDNFFEIDEFLDVLAEHKTVTSKEKLGVRIQSIGMHINYIREFKRKEKYILDKSCKAMSGKSNKSQGRKKVVQQPAVADKVNESCGSGKKVVQQVDTIREKTLLDKRFGFLSDRIKQFSTEWGINGSKHIHFISSSSEAEDEDEDEDNEDDDTHQVGAERVTSCPYPSKTEEMMRLGLKSEISDKASPSNYRISDSDCNKSSCKKRKCEAEDGRSWKRSKENRGKKAFGKVAKLEKRTGSALSFSKFLKKEKVFAQKRSRHLVLSRFDIENFIAIWKEACCTNPVSEVFERMLTFYNPAARTEKKIKKMIRRQKAITNIFLQYPAIALLNVAVAAIRCGMLDSLYDTFQDLGEPGAVNSIAKAADVVELEPLNENATSNTRKKCHEMGCGVTADDIVKQMIKFFDSDLNGAIKADYPFGRLFTSMKMFNECELQLANHFSVMTFSSLGHGNFCDFLKKHAHLLPKELHRFLKDDLHGQSRVEVSLLEQQIGALLYQAKSNLVIDNSVSESHFSMLLQKQYPTISFHIVANEPEKCFAEFFGEHMDIQSTNCVMFSSALLQKRHNEKTLLSNDRPSIDATVNSIEMVQENCSLETISSRDAMECLLKAPILSDLLSWSHWDLIYAPTLGPLLQWLMNKVRHRELCCIATIGGKLIRIDPSATLDELLEAMIRCSPYRVASKLLSLLHLYGGINNAPISLLKCYAQRAIDVFLRNSADSLAERENLLLNSSKVTKNSLGAVEDINHRNDQSKVLSRINGVFITVSRFILDCLNHLPSEFRSFAAEILVSGFRHFTKDAPFFILKECTKTNDRLMLHDIGLSIGILEWIDDYNEFSKTNIDLYSSFMNANETCHYLSLESTVEKTHAPDIFTEQLCNGSGDLANFMSDAPLANEKQNLASNHADASSEDNHRLCDDVPGWDKLEDGNFDVLDCKKIRDAKLIIETIRREEFGLEPNLNCSESDLLRKQHARLGRALHCLSQELYSQDSHLLLELVQNADDNAYLEDVDPALVFILHDTGIVVLNNEQGFSAQNIRALCDIGKSTKKGSAGYIGRKGIGFKSVFRVTDAPEIHSNGFHVKFDITDGQIGFVLPTALSPCDIRKFTEILSDDDYENCGTHWNTCILLPFRSSFIEGACMNSIISMFSDLHPSLLLFLHRLRCIKFKNMLDDSLVIMRKETLGDGVVKVSHGKEKMSWLVVSRKVEASAIRPDVQNTEISLAFPLQELDNGDYKPHLCQQPVFSFLPLRNYGLKFILQADFVLPSSREEVDGNSAWNQWLLSEFPDLFVSAEHSFCALPCFRENFGKAVTAFMSFVPSVGNVHGFFSRLPHMIISKLRMSNCLLLDGYDSEWVLPCRVLRGWDEHARLLISEELLQKHLGLGYLHKDVLLTDSLAKALGVQDYGPKVLLEVILSACRNNDITLMGLDWLSTWLDSLYSILLVHASSYLSRDSGLEDDILSTLKGTPFIPLSDGSFSSVEDGPIWLPCDICTIGFEGKQNIEEFPYLYAKLRTVNPLLFCKSETNASEVDDTRIANVKRMLHKVGVQELSAHEVIKNHILVSLSDDKFVGEEVNLMVEYLSFIMLHFQYACASCLIEKEEIISVLKRRRIVLTRHGLRCPGEEHIHFGGDYKNPFDISKLIDPVDWGWLEVDGCYLQHPSTRSLPQKVTKWRNFFQEVGVTDFVQVDRVSKNVSEILHFLPHDVICGVDILSTSCFYDWESSEFDELLSTLSLERSREKCIYLLDVLDKIWDDSYREKARINFGSLGSVDHTQSSFMKSIRRFGWVASSTDNDLHQPKDLFYDCEEIRCVLGAKASYAVPQVTSKLLVKDIGFKTHLTLDDALSVLNSWTKRQTAFRASITQMSKLYTFISREVAASGGDAVKAISSSAFIFVPFLSYSTHEDLVPGIFLSPGEVYWHDPTGCVDKAKDIFLTSTSLDRTSCRPFRTLASIYPTLFDFFVEVCGVHFVPTFGGYLDLLLQLTDVALPSQAAQVVFQVFLNWADGFSSGLVKSDEKYKLKESFYKLENAVLPTLQDKWVSLHCSFGCVCWSDDENLEQQFRNSIGVYFLHFGQLSDNEKDLFSGKIAAFLKAIGIPSLSEVVQREAIFYGIVNDNDATSLINWILPFAQRYIFKQFPDKYFSLKMSENLKNLRVTTVEELLYIYTLKGCENTSQKRHKCSCLLQENILYVTRSIDFHSLFLELSRLFFNGSTDLQLANFLHMVTTMAESSSTSEQIEFFIVNSQMIPRLPADEPLWCLVSSTELQTDGVSQLILAPPFPDSNQKIFSRQEKPGLGANWLPTNLKNASGIQHAQTHHHQTLPHRTLSENSKEMNNWPPTDWKTAPDLQYARMHCNHNKATLSANMEMETSKSPEDVIPEDLPVDIDCDWILAEDLMREEQSCAVNALDPPNRRNSSFQTENVVAEENSAEFALERNTLRLHTPDGDKLRKTGRRGELIAYRYFTNKLGSNRVRWVNQDAETGLPYDLIIGVDEKVMEYVEVKATRSAYKDWFEITTREWQFAAQMGDSFSIAQVVLHARKATIKVLKNPIKLCQQGLLQLAVLMSKQINKSPAQLGDCDV